MPVRIYGRYRTAGDAKVTRQRQGRRHSRSSRRSTCTFPKEDDANPEIERMWAWHRVDRLLKEADAAGRPHAACSTRSSASARGTRIVTEYTSFIVLENDAEYQRWKIERKNALRFARSEEPQRLAMELAQLRDKATAELGPAAAEPAAAPTCGRPRRGSRRRRRHPRRWRMGGAVTSISRASGLAWRRRLWSDRGAGGGGVSGGRHEIGTPAERVMTVRSAIAAARRSGGAALSLLPAILIAHCTAWVAKGLEYDRAEFAVGEMYRLFTCHWTHWNVEHLAWDAAAFAALAIACEARGRRRFLEALILSAIVVPIGLFLLQPEMLQYRGLSALASALFALLSIDLLCERFPARRGSPLW